MNRNRAVCLGFLVMAGSMSIFLALIAKSEAVVDRTIKAKIIVSRHRASPGDVVEFKFQLIDANGRSKPIPRSSRSSKSSPRLALYDSEGREIGIYSFRFGWYIDHT